MKKSLVLLSCLISQVIIPSSTPRKTEPFQVIFHKKATLDSKKRYVLGGDVNISEIKMGVFEVIDNKPKLVLEFKTETKQIGDNFTKYFVAVMDYLKQQHPAVSIDLACVASPGNTSANKDYIKFSHLSFALDGSEIQKATGLKKLFIINDFEVVGFGIQAIDQSNIVMLHAGKHRALGTKLIIGAGNGLGTGLMLYNEKLTNYMPYPISWSFVEFSPQNELELKLNNYLQKETGSRAWGKVLGAQGGILRMYEFLNLHNEYKTPPVKYSHYQEVFDNARAGDKRCKDAVDLYMHLYARLIRNAVYSQLPYNGVYITNSIAEKNPELFKNPEFIKEVFKTDNDYLLNYITEVPFYLVLEHSGLHMYGAALYALVYETTK